MERRNFDCRKPASPAHRHWERWVKGRKGGARQLSHENARYRGTAPCPLPVAASAPAAPRWHITLGTSLRHDFARMHARTVTPHRPAILPQSRHLERRHSLGAAGTQPSHPPTHRHRHPQTMPAPDPLDDVDMTVPMLMMLSCAARNHACATHPHLPRPTERPMPGSSQSRRVRLLHLLQQGLEARQERKQGQATRS